MLFLKVLPLQEATRFYVFMATFPHSLTFREFMRCFALVPLFDNQLPPAPGLPAISAAQPTFHSSSTSPPPSPQDTTSTAATSSSSTTTTATTTTANAITTPNTANTTTAKSTTTAATHESTHPPLQLCLHPALWKAVNQLLLGRSEV